MSFEENNKAAGAVKSPQRFKKLAKVIPAPYRPKSDKPADNTRRGFLYIHCCHCGTNTGLKTKREMYTFTCRGCFGKTELSRPLTQAAYTCTRCGKTFRYHTNLITGFDINCLNCGAVNHLAYNPETGDYRQRL